MKRKYHKIIKLSVTALSLIVLNLFFLEVHKKPNTVSAQNGSTWYMAGANPQRTSWLANEDVSGIAGVTWYRPIEAYIDQKTQLITANQKVYVATTKGLIVLDAETGQLRWRFDTELPLANSPTVIGDMVYFGGYDRKVYALRDTGSSYQVVWEFNGAKAGYSVNPLVVNSTVYIGSRDGYFYALNATNGNLVWQYPAANQPSLNSILNSAAFDNGTLYFAAQDMHAYALNATNGNLVWKSPQKLPGESYQSWWPVVYDNYVVFSAAPAYKNTSNPGTFSFLSGHNIKEIFRDSFFPNSTSGNSGDLSIADVTSGWPTGSTILDTQSNSGLSYSLDSYFTQYPQLRVFPILNKSTGVEDFTLPFMYSGTFSGNVYPPIVNPNTNALYANNLYSGTGGSGISRTTLMGWKPGNKYLQVATNATWAIDEPMSYAGAGQDTLFSLCCDRAAGTVSGTRWWDYGPSPGLLDNVLPSTGTNKYDPMWQKYSETLERLQAYYKGSSLRTNGADSRNGYYNSHGLQNPLIPYTFTNGSGQTVKRIFIHRSNSIIALGTTASETYLPLIEVNAAPSNTSQTLSSSELTSLLEKEIDKIVSVYEANPTNGFLNPAYYNSGTAIPGRLDPPSFAFQNPGDGLTTLSWAYQHISDPTLKTRLDTYLHAYYNRYFGTSPIISIGWTGQSRDEVSYPPEVQTSMSAIPDSNVGTFAQRNFYGLWKYAQDFPSDALAVYNRFQSRIVVPSGLTDTNLVETPHKFNEYIAGYVGFLNLQQLAGRDTIDTTLRTSVQNELNSLLTRRAQGFAKDMPWYGVNDNPTGITINNYARQFNVARNFLYMTPELGTYFQQNSSVVTNQAFNEYAYLTPFWFTAETDNAFQEGVKTHLFDRPALFAAKAWVTGASQSELSKYIDAPTFYRGDLFYIQNLVTTLEAPGSSTTPTPNPLPGDINGDSTVNILDYTILSNNFGSSNSLSDLNSDGTVNILDFTILSNNFGTSI